ncbi:MAG: glycine cleavage system protein [Actinomycetota bacterium]|jgi:glycine cleavage system H protein|nr:glycine cleavage system protein [Actinomycetota bacterium]
MEFPDDLRYSAEHEWVRVDGTEAVVGITDFAQDTLGDIVYVQPPEVGATLAHAASVAEVESTKSVSDIYAPLGGRVVAVNEALGNTPELLNSDPYGDGWIFRIEMADPAELETLMDAAAYRALVAS